MRARLALALAVPVLATTMTASGQPAPPQPAAAPQPAPADRAAEGAQEPSCERKLEMSTTIKNTAEATLRRYAGPRVAGANCGSLDLSGAVRLESEGKALQMAVDLADCAHAGTTPTQRQQGNDLQAELSELARRLTVAIAQMKAEAALRAAKKARQDAAKARNLDDAKTAAKAAAEQAKAAREAQQVADEACTQEKVKAAETLADEAQAEVQQREAGPDSICGADEFGKPESFCGIYGISAAALSYLWTVNGEGVGSGRRLATVGVPAGGLRWRVSDWLGVDLAGYSAFITKSLASASPSVEKTSCSRSPTEYETRLPCEATNEMYAYVGVYAGLTVGRKGVGFVTVSPITAGIAQIGTRSTLLPYVGMSIGVLQLNGNF